MGCRRRVQTRFQAYDLSLFRRTSPGFVDRRICVSIRRLRYRSGQVFRKHVPVGRLGTTECYRYSEAWASFHSGRQSWEENAESENRKLAAYACGLFNAACVHAKLCTPRRCENFDRFPWEQNYSPLLIRKLTACRPIATLPTLRVLISARSRILRRIFHCVSSRRVLSFSARYLE